MCGCGDLKYAPKTHNHSQYVTTKELNSVLADYLTEQETIDYLTANYYTKTEVDALIADLQDQIDALVSQAEPVGTIRIWTGVDVPDNDWIECRGQSFSTSTYPELFALIGYSFGGSGSSFSLPDLRKKVPVGLHSGFSGFDTIGDTGGEENHTLTTDELPSHTHPPAGGDAALVTQIGSGTSVVNGPPGGSAQMGIRLATGSTGNSQPHNNLQPYVIVNFIIKVQ